MRILDFIVSKQKLKRDPQCDFAGIAAGSRGYLYARFRFSDDWAGCRKVAVFSCNGEEYPVAIIRGMCMIPSEALVGNAVFVRVVGQRDDYRITSCSAVFQQLPGGYE